jgi:tetratricopeptide (TPR) repeat protein
MKTMPRRLVILVVGLGLAVGVWFGVWAVREWRFRRELRQAELAYIAKRYVEAGARLARLARSWPKRGEVAYWLGSSEMIQGHDEAALEAWGRVPDEAREAQLAALARGRLATKTGRYALAETCLARARRGGGDMGDEARRLLGNIHWMTGRRDEYLSYLEREVEGMRDPSETLRILWSVDYDPYPMDGVRLVLETANRTAPEDDRVWLALADLETRAGRFEEAGNWLAKCERARPDDRAVWRVRLTWAKAAGRPDEVVRAAAHLPATSFTQAGVLELRAWMAERSGDRKAERAALESLIALDPVDAAAVERLADLAVQDGKRERVAELRRRKADIETVRESYRQLINQPELAPRVAELARAAEALGRRFDAKAWWRIAAHRDPSLEGEAAAARARLAKAEPPPAASGGSLADLLGPLRAPGGDRDAVAGHLSVPTFDEDGERRGLVFTFENGITDLRQIPETMSGGVAVIDFDGDGWLDIYAVQGGPFPPRTGSLPFGDRLFRNCGDGRFEDATASSGLAALPGGYGHGVAVGDFDNDGRPDLFITRWGSYALYHNLGQGRFEDFTTRAGLGGEREWPTSAAWADLDNDGDLDLYVCHYLKWDTANPVLCGYPGNPAAGNTYCDPRGFPALPDHVFRNDGGRFVDVTKEAGIVDPDGRGLGVVAADLDADGKIDLFVANDTTSNYFFHNRGGFRFTEEGLESGLATNAGGGYLAGMGVAYGDFDGDGRLDLAVTNFLNQSTTLYHNHGGGIFSDRSVAAGLAAATRPVLGFGLAALDANNDGHLDLAQANGHVGDYRPANPYAMTAQLFLGDGAGKLFDVSDRAGPPWRVLRLARGLATGDFDNDGRIDILLVCENAPLALLRNRAAPQDQKLTAAGGHFLMLKLEGSGSNRDAVGARVAVTVAGRTQVTERFGGGSYLSASDGRLHFGLGPATKVDRVEVTWPSGRRDRYHGRAADAGYRLREGDPEPKPLAGFPAATTQR